MQFAITRHSPYLPPPDALNMLWERLDGLRRDEISFAKAGRRITAKASDDPPHAMTREEWTERTRRSVLEIVREVCGRDERLKADWFAIDAVE